MSFLSKVFGGSGGIFGAVLGVASMFFPPLALAGSLSNMLTSAIGEAVKMAASTLVKEFAMPKFLEGLIGSAVDGVVSNLNSQNPSEPQVDAYVQQHAGDQLTTLRDELAKTISQGTKDNLERLQQSGGSKAKGKASVSSWLEAIALAMGEAMGEKASTMVGLANELRGLSESAGKIDSKNTTAQQANAQKFNEVNARLSGVSQEYNLLSNAFNNTIKSIGEALSQMARKG